MTSATLSREALRSGRSGGDANAPAIAAPRLFSAPFLSAERIFT